MIILCDIDDTLSNFAEHLLNCLNKDRGTTFQFSEVDTWDWFIRTYDDPWEPCKKKEFWDNVTINSFAVETLENFIKEGHQVYLCSASFYDEMLYHKLRTVLKHFTLLTEKNVIICYNKQLVRGDIRIDDNPDNMSIHSINLLLDKPWNQDCKIPWKKRCYGWQDVADQLHNICSMQDYYE